MPLVIPATAFLGIRGLGRLTSFSLGLLTFLVVLDASAEQVDDPGEEPREALLLRRKQPTDDIAFVRFFGFLRVWERVDCLEEPFSKLFFASGRDQFDLVVSQTPEPDDFRNTVDLNLVLL